MRMLIATEECFGHMHCICVQVRVTGMCENCMLSLSLFDRNKMNAVCDARIMHAPTVLAGLTSFRINVFMFL